MRAGLLQRLLALFGLAAALLAPHAAAAPAQRVVSLNLCTDQLVLALVPPDAIVALGVLASDPRVSPVALGAASLPSVAARADAVLPLQPDLVLAGQDSARFTTDALRHVGVRVEVIPDADTVDALLANLVRVGAAVGRPERADDAVASVRAWLDVLDRRVARLGDTHPRALVLAAGGFVAGRGTLADALLARAGLRNAAADAGIDGFARLTLERVLRIAPDVLITDADAQGGASQAGQWMRHPALSHARWRHIAIPGRAWSCGTPLALRAVERLLDAREEWVDTR
jgi:iron complex transport system substrate-binding protein